MSRFKAFSVILAILILNICSNNISVAIQEVDAENVYPDYATEFTGKDTFEKFNRKLFVFNLRLNRVLIRPVNVLWASVMPQYGMDRLQNAYNNMNYPVRLVSCLFQKDFKTAKTETVRFLTNTTLGFGGLYDPALKKFKIDSCQEDISQVLAKSRFKRGPYLVLPVVRGNIRDLVGKLLDCPLRPTSYVGPFGAAASALFAVNNSTYMQAMIKKVDGSYADPYQIAKEYDGIDTYIKTKNLDRKSVLDEQMSLQKVIEISDSSSNNSNNKDLSQDETLKPDIEVSNFEAQGPEIVSLRSSFFDCQKIDSSIWSDVSLWNRSFSKRIRTASVNIFTGRPNYKYRYILQKNKKSPLAILYPTIGDGILSDKSVVLAKILYDEGYSIMIMGSSFNWEFIKSMPKDFRPGLPAKDATYLRKTTAKAINNIETTKGYKFDKKVLVGCSFGAMTGLFVASQEKQDNTLNVSKYIAINPPIELLYALRQVDKYSAEWKNEPSDLKMRTAINAEKIVKLSKNIYHKDAEKMPNTLPFTEKEAKQIISFLMEQDLYDAVFVIEECSRSKKSGLDKNINKLSFNDYAKKYLLVNSSSSIDDMSYETSFRSISSFLENNNNYKIYLTADDYFVSKDQLIWLKKHSNNNSIIFSNGSHLGTLYRREFLDRFKSDTVLTNLEPSSGL